MNKNDAFLMGGYTADRLGFDTAHRIGNQIAAMECARASEERYIEELYQYVKNRCERGLPVSEEDLYTLRRAGFIVTQTYRQG